MVTKYDLDLVVEDGTVSAAVPNDVVDDASLLWRSFVLGYFSGDAPHIGTVHGIVNRIWNNTKNLMKIDAQFLNDKAVLFHVEDESIMAHVRNRQFWHIADIPMVVRPLLLFLCTSLELTSIPMWVHF